MAARVGGARRNDGIDDDEENEEEKEQNENAVLVWSWRRRSVVMTKD